MLKNSRFVKQLVYYFMRYFAEDNIRKYKPLIGYSFDSVHLMINVFGVYEQDEINQLNRVFRKLNLEGELALDVGANIGNHTVRLFSDFFKNVFCFEPNPKTFEALEINVKDLEHVQCFNYGLGSRVDKLPFRRNDTNIGASKIIVDSTNTDDTNVIMIEVFPLDKIKLGKPVSLIKLDIEGHEHEFLKGAEKTIRTDIPLILFEENFENTDHYGKSKVIKQLEDWGYDFYVFKPNYYFGNTKFSKLMGYLFQDLFGANSKIVRENSFDKKSYSMIIGVHGNSPLNLKEF